MIPDQIPSPCVPRKRRGVSGAAWTSIALSFLMLLCAGVLVPLWTRKPDGFEGLGLTIVLLVASFWIAMAGIVLAPVALTISAAALIQARSRTFRHMLVSLLGAIMTLMGLFGMVGPCLAVRHEMMEHDRAGQSSYAVHAQDAAMSYAVMDCETYASAHGSAYPRSLAELQQWAQKAGRGLRTRSFDDLIYLGAGYSDMSCSAPSAIDWNDNPAPIVLIRRTPVTDGVYTVGFLGRSQTGAAQPVAARDLAAELHHCDQQRAKLGLPPLADAVLQELGLAPQERSGQKSR